MKRPLPSRIRASLIDCLIAPSDFESLSVLKRSLERDLDWLLNTVAAGDVPEELADSLYAYGLPDFSRLSLPEQEDQLLDMIATAIECFEPRILPGFRVLPLRTRPDANRTISLLIEGRLRVQPAPVPVSIRTEIRVGADTAA